MTREDVIDVLSTIAVGDRRTVGRTDVEFWFTVLGDLPKDAALEAVAKHFREKPGVWLEPGHIVERVKAMRRDELEREPAAALDARQKALERKVAADVAELAATKSVPLDELKFRRPQSSALAVRCPWCRASVGNRCTVPRTTQQLVEYHPSRIEAAKAVA